MDTGRLVANTLQKDTTAERQAGYEEHKVATTFEVGTRSPVGSFRLGLADQAPVSDVEDVVRGAERRDATVLETAGSSHRKSHHIQQGWHDDASRRRQAGSAGRLLASCQRWVLRVVYRNEARGRIDDRPSGRVVERLGKSRIQGGSLQRRSFRDHASGVVLQIAENAVGESRWS